MRATFLSSLGLAAILMVCTGTANGQTDMGTTFTYQGQLKDTSGPVSDACDFIFRLWDNASGGTQQGLDIPVSPSVDEGLFTVELDFGEQYNGQARWLEMEVCCPSGSCSLETLSPRTELTPAPYAVTAGSVPGGLNGSGSGSYLAKFTGTDTLADSTLYESDGKVGIGTSSPTNTLTVDGDIDVGGFFASSESLQNPSFESPISPDDWIYEESDSMFYGQQSTAYATEGTFSYLLANVETTVTSGMYAQIHQDVDLTDAAEIYFDATHLTDNGWWDQSYAEVLIDDDILWQEWHQGTWNDVVVDVSGYTGTHALKFRLRFFYPIGNLWGKFHVDNVRTTGGPIIPTLQTSSGNVGIRTATPATALDVNGTVTADAFVGDGSGLTNLPTVPDAWNLTGNGGTTPGTHFLGTTDDTALELRVNGDRAMRIEPTGSVDSDCPNIIAGSHANSISAGLSGVTIAGGGDTGSANQATGIFASIGGGMSNIANHFASVAGGQNNEATSDYATISGGQSNVASDTFATVTGGFLNTASGECATVLGGSANQATGDFSIAAGVYAEANHERSFVWSDGWSGTFASTDTGQFLINATGGVGIGTNAPARKLHISGNSGSPPTLLLQSTEAPSGDQTLAIWADVSTGDFSIGRMTDNGSSLARKDIVIDAGTGNVGIGDPTPDVELDVIGSIHYTGSITDVSDARLKENIVPVLDALAKVRQLNGVYFTMKDAPEQREAGLIAQDVQKVLPEAVSVIDPEMGYLGVSYPSLIPLLVEAIKEMQDDNDTRIAHQEREITELRARIETLEHTASTGTISASLPFVLVGLCGLVALRRRGGRGGV